MSNKFGLLMEMDAAAEAALSTDPNAVKEFDIGETHARTLTEIRTGRIDRKYQRPEFQVAEDFIPRPPVSGARFLTPSELREMERLEKEEEMEERRAARK